MQSLALSLLAIVQRNAGPAECDDSKCTSAGDPPDCCAPTQLDEAATCKPGWTPIRRIDQPQCFSFSDGAYRCCREGVIESPRWGLSVAPSLGGGCRGTALSVAECLNARYQGGHPSSDLAQAGVLVHIFDSTTDHKTGRLQPWAPPFLSASLVSAQAGGLFNSDNGLNGWVLSPEHVQISCAWHTDGGTSGRKALPGCVAGCTCPGYAGEVMEWCSSSWGGYCPYRPAALVDMLKNHRDPVGGTRYNEIILAGSAWQRSLPDSIEACFGNGCEGPWPRVSFAFGRGFW